MNFKKIFFVFGALGMLLSSCNKIAEVEDLNESSGLPHVITATFDATRTSVDNDWNTAWEENDEMTVYVTRESGSGRKYGYSQFTYKGDGKFDGTVNRDFCSPFNWFAVYPSFHSSSSTASKVEAEIEHPATQTMTGNTKTHIAGANDPIFGYALGVEKDPSIRMHHIASVIDFNITNGSDKAIKVTKVEFTAPGKIAGKFTADINLWDGEVEAPDWKADNSAVNTVTLNVSDGAQIAKAGKGDFYAAIHPISADGDYTIKVTATSEGKTYVTEKTVKANLTFKAGKYRTLNFTFVPGEPEPDQKSYVKVTNAPQDWSGTYLIVDESAKKAFNENASNYASSVTINDGKVLWDEDVAKYQVTISPSTVSGMYDIKTAKGKYMYSYQYGETTLNSENTQSSNTYYNSLTFNGGNVTMYSTRTGSGGSVNYFGYVSKTSDNPNSKNFGYKEDATTRTVQLYKLKEGTPGKQDQTLSFEKSEIEWTLGDTYKIGNTYTAQSVNGAKTTVTYTSSNESVATVASDGKITIKGSGQSTITATAAEDATYNSATASYSLTIKPASAPSTEKTYTKVTTAPSDWSGTYLIVDENSKNAFAYDQTGYKKSVSISSSKIVSNDLEKYEMTISVASGSDATHYNIKTSDGKYLYRSSDSNFLNDSETYNSNKYYAKIGEEGFISLGTKYSRGTEYFFRYSSSAFGFGTDKTATIQLYKLQNGDTPPTPPGTVFNLENDHLKAYLDAAEKQYSNSTTSTIVSTYASRSDAYDLPKPVTLSWTGSATGISIYEGSTTTGSAVKTMNFSSSSSVDIYNLIPGKTYSYKTSNNQTGTFSTTGRRRMIKVSDTQSDSHARNCRDLGGVQTRDGKTLKYGLIYRGTNVDNLTEAERKILHDELGIRLDQDLRSEAKTKTSSPIGSDVEFCNHGGYDASTIANQNGDNMKQSVLHVMEAVIEGRPVYFHCRIGSDRTGHMGMLYLALLGCDLKECDIDYEITSFASKMTGGTRKIGSGNEESFRSKFIKSPYNNNSVPEAVEAYVTGTLGISLDTVKKFRKAMGASETLN